MTPAGTWSRLALCAALLACGTPLEAAAGLEGRVIAGYQGWFGCPGDFAGNKEWQHWFTGAPRVESLTVDALPALTGFRTQDLCDTGLKRADGSSVHVFSSQNPHVVDRHFEWMKRHGIDGVAFQRFVSHTRDPELRKRSDNVLSHVRSSAERHGRVFYVTYDISGADPATVVAAIREDWKRLGGALGVTRSSAYVRQGDRPVLQLWGFGFSDRPGTAEEASALIGDLRAGGAGLQKATVVGGVPTGWRTLTGDSRKEAAWAGVYRSYDVISPWAVGRFRDETGADGFRRKVIEPDLAEARRLGIGYMPVVFPGFSWRNLMTTRGETSRAILNQIPRRCGNFMWRQVVNVLEAGAGSMFAAMFDEADEATALFELEGRAERAPAGAAIVALNDGGCVVPGDWYLRITGKAADLLRSGAPAPKALGDALKP